MKIIDVRVYDFLFLGPFVVWYSFFVDNLILHFVLLFTGVLTMGFNFLTWFLTIKGSKYLFLRSPFIIKYLGGYRKSKFILLNAFTVVAVIFFLSALESESAPLWARIVLILNATGTFFYNLYHFVLLKRKTVNK
ncbi:MAG TPA: hypothetical protein VJ103_02670 [Candidatus Paceibacterota bacterium]|nr:hypothetical protein [Candidatus Paceibacterota bacterium]